MRKFRHLKSPSHCHRATLTLLLAISLIARIADCLTQGTCTSNADCNVDRNNERCVMPDYFDQPLMWPPCPHLGHCACTDDFVLMPDGTCKPYINLNLYDRCNNQINERYLQPMQRCGATNGTRHSIECNKPLYIDSGGYCALAPIEVEHISTQVPYLEPVWTPTIVGFLDDCGTSDVECNRTQGLACWPLGADLYAGGQCLCAGRYEVFDYVQYQCRQRGYGDVCLATEDCNNGQISLPGGFECRLGRCRCANGYEPYDILNWDYATRSPVPQRICIIIGATTWVPTGHRCTMNPGNWSSSTSTRLCHPRAFCYLCRDELVAAGKATKRVPVSGTCRELACSLDTDCLGSPKTFCNNWASQFDPPCDNGMCDCQTQNGYFKDRFSRCSPYRKLQLGDRCIPLAPLGLHPWYQTNEIIDEELYCQLNNGSSTGYAAYTWGTVTCRPPYYEDVNGRCVANDYPPRRYRHRSFNETCDVHYRWPCNASQGLTCGANGYCVCDVALVNSQTEAPNWIGCNTRRRFSPTVIWDGTTCRQSYLGDQCRFDSECSGGDCVNSTCVCPYRTIPLAVTSLLWLDNSVIDIDVTLVTYPFCFSNYTLVDKGDECHLDPIAWHCDTSIRRFNYGYQGLITLYPLVCRSPLICVRCPSDYRPDDQSRGICRAFTALSYASLPKMAADECAGAGEVVDYGSSSLIPALNGSNITTNATDTSSSKNEARRSRPSSAALSLQLAVAVSSLLLLIVITK